ncbi:hypothetical protein L7F22_026814 [Adiantum nelumboides]|nr:hypothetical protein [Adiantum nelumboides]
MTARNMQDKAKRKGLPWSAAKGFDTFNPVSSFIEKSKVADAQNVRLWLKVNDQTRQDGNTEDMIFPIPQLIEHVSSIMTLQTGDLLLTGTPKGVGSVQAARRCTPVSSPAARSSPSSGSTSRIAKASLSSTSSSRRDLLPALLLSPFSQACIEKNKIQSVQ